MAAETRLRHGLIHPKERQAGRSASFLGANLPLNKYREALGVNPDLFLCKTRMKAGYYWEKPSAVTGPTIVAAVDLATTESGPLTIAAQPRVDRILTFDIDSWTAGSIVATITGTNLAGDDLTEEVTIDSDTAVDSTNAYSSITSITYTESLLPGSEDLTVISSAYYIVAATTINGTTADELTIAAQPDCARTLQFAFASDPTGEATFTIRGTDIEGLPLTESVTLNASDYDETTDNAFATVESISYVEDGDVTAVNLTVGVTANLGLPEPIDEPADGEKSNIAEAMSSTTFGPAAVTSIVGAAAGDTVDEARARSTVLFADTLDGSFDVALTFFVGWETVNDYSFWEKGRFWK